MSKEPFSTNKGFSLVEILVSVSIFLLFSFAFASVVTTSFSRIHHAPDRERATALAEEGLEAVRNIKIVDFSQLINGSYGLSVTDDHYVLISSSDATDIFTRTIHISDWEDGPGIKRVESEVSWTDGKNVSLVTYVADWSAVSCGPDPVGYWPFDENEGCIAYDTHGGNNGTLGPDCPANSPLWITGKIQSALKFNGGDDHVLVENSGELNPTEELTLTAWVKWDASPTAGNQWATILNKHVDRQYRLQHNQGNTLFEFAVRTSSGGRWVVSTTQPEEGEWYHVAGTYDGEALRIYVDGVMENSVAWSGALATSSSPLVFGNRSAGDRGFDGVIDEIGIWCRALNGEEVEELYLAGVDDDDDEFCGGSGTIEDPYLVCTAHQLNRVREILSAHYRLNNDIDLDVAPYNAGAGWEPIGNSDDRFTGTFDGAGNTVSNLFINRPDEDYVGLFGRIHTVSGNDAGVSHLGLTNVAIHGSGYTGGIVGHIGGMWNTSASITQSFVQGNISGGGSTGGIAGYTAYKSLLENVYSICTIDGGWGTGGISGSHWGASNIIRNAYSASELTGGRGVGGVIGQGLTGNVIDSYWNTDLYPSSPAGTGKTTEEMKHMQTFSAWNISYGSEDLQNGYPYFSWQAGGGDTVWFIHDDGLDDVVIESCEEYCATTGYSGGACRQNPRQCELNNETYESGGDAYCPGPPQRDCCCQE